MVICSHLQTLWDIHCVSEDLHMGKGIAVTFKEKFGGVEDLRSQCAPTGGMFLKRGDRYIYYLVTNQRYYHKPTYDTFKSSLEAMKAHCFANNVNRLSMPLIGCGLDRLQWAKVKQILNDVFAQSNISITIYKLAHSDSNNNSSSSSYGGRGGRGGRSFQNHY